MSERDDGRTDVKSPLLIRCGPKHKANDGDGTARHTTKHKVVTYTNGHKCLVFCYRLKNRKVPFCFPSVSRKTSLMKQGATDAFVKVHFQHSSLVGGLTGDCLS